MDKSVLELISLAESAVANARHASSLAINGHDEYAVDAQVEAAIAQAYATMALAVATDNK